MTRDELWALFVKRNPTFETGPIEFRPVTLRKFFDTVWAQAQKEVPESSPASPFPDALRDLMKGKY
jgi:hypothetical protein